VSSRLHVPIRRGIRSTRYTSVFYSRQVEKNNFTVCYVNSQGIKHYGEISCFYQTSDGTKMVLVNSFDIEHLRCFRHSEARVLVNHIIPVKISDSIALIPVENIMFKVIRVGTYVCCQPNKVEVNL